MNRAVGVWLTVAVASAVMAGSVLYAAHVQETTAETNFGETQVAWNMRASILEQERGLDGFLTTGRALELQPYFTGKRDITFELAQARAQSNDDRIELSLVDRQAAILQRWQVDAAAELSEAKSDPNGIAARAADRASDGLIARFLSTNVAYADRLAVKRHAEEDRAALIPVWLICGLSVLFGIGGWLYARRRRLARVELDRIEQAARDSETTMSSVQARFVEALQVSESQPEAHSMIVRHLETAIPDSQAIVRNRNNSADRLESTSALPEDHPLIEPLQDSSPRSCLAVRLNRQYQRGGRQDEVLTCSICGALPTASACEPLVVGGEVIGSVLVALETPLSRGQERLLVESVAQAAPVLANLRNLALAENRAATDALTGLPNRRAIDDTLKRMVAQTARAGSAFSAVLVDLDHFKKINDTYGHDRGDEVLAAFGALLRDELRESDLGGRTGGEEFVLLLPDTDRDGAVALATKIRLALHRLRIRDIEQPITASFGVASYPADTNDTATILRIADRALYLAKRNGRDRIETAATLPARDGVVGLVDPEDLAEPPVTNGRHARS